MTASGAGADEERGRPKYFGQSAEEMLFELKRQYSTHYPENLEPEHEIEKLLSLQMKTWSHTVGLSVLQVDSAGDPQTQLSFTGGSGVLVEFGDSHYIATCAHIFSAFPRNSFCVIPQQMQWAQVKKDDVIQGSRVRFLGSPTLGLENSHPGDLALIQVSPETFVLNGHVFYKLADPLRDLDLPYDGWGCGVPGRFREDKLDGSSLMMPGACTCVPCQLCTDPVWSSEGERVRDILEARIRRMPYARGKELAEAPDTFAGVSGGGLWFLTDTDPLLAGIVVHENPTRLKAVNINLWMDFARNTR